MFAYLVPQKLKREGFYFIVSPLNEVNPKLAQLIVPEESNSGINKTVATLVNQIPMEVILISSQRSRHNLDNL